jgi:hypothetical protein
MHKIDPIIIDKIITKNGQSKKIRSDRAKGGDFGSELPRKLSGSTKLIRYPASN